MIIPKLHYITQGASPQEHVNNIQKACTAGIELVQLDLKGVSKKRISKLAHKAREITAHYQTRLFITNDVNLAINVKADGVHLNKENPAPTAIRKQLYSWQMLGGTANTLAHCERLISKEVDYIRLGPFRSDAVIDSDMTVLGIQGYTAIIDALNTKTPILAYGSIHIADVAALLETGISGLAVSDAITQNFDSIRTFHQLLNASSSAEQRHTFG